MNTNTRPSTIKTIGGVLLALISLLAAQTAAELVASLFIVLGAPMGIGNIIAGILYIVFAFLILKLLTKKFLKSTPKEHGMSRFHLSLKWNLIAVILPASVLATCIFCLKGEFVSSELSAGKTFEILTAGIVFNSIGAGFVEEMVFRGVILHLLQKRWNTAVAVILPSVLFAAVHLLGQDFTATSCILVLLAGSLVGIMFSLIELESRSVWSGAIVHSIWNIAMISGLLTVKPAADPESVMTYVLDSKSVFLTGGQFGIESSIIACVAYLVVIALAAGLLIRVNRKEEKIREIPSAHKICNNVTAS